jgi:site-specific recombinase XerD
MIVNFFTRKGSKQADYLYVRLTLDKVCAEVRLEYTFTKGNSKLGAYKDKVKGELLDLYNTELLAGRPSDPKTIKTLYLSKNKVFFLLEVFQAYINNKLKPRLEKKDLSWATYEKYPSLYNHLADFLDARGSGDINMQMVDAAFIDDFDSYLRQFNGHNTAVKNLSRLKAVTTYAFKVKKYILHDPFATVKLTAKKTSPTVLTETELLAIIQKKLVIPRLDQVRDLFLFQCFTGLAYADMKKLDKNWIENEEIIRISRQKNDEPTVAYMYQIAAKILNKYNYQLPVTSNQKMNAYLKEIADICGINKRLTTHAARHTYATTVNLNNGVSLETVQKLLGHATIKQTQHYAKLTTHKVVKDCKVNGDRVNQIYGKPRQTSFFDN